jgi:large subunit ribosomal protein L17
MAQRTFSRKTGERAAFMKSLLHNLIVHGSMATTVARAKSVRVAVEKLVTVAKKQDTAHLRILIARLPHKNSAEKLFYEIAPRYKERKGGYTRIIKQGIARKRDGASTAVIEFV